MSYKFPYRWNLADGFPAKGIESNGLNVFGTFICGGGSTMGYKLAGYNHIGGVEIDPPIANIYKANHKPKYLYNMDIRDFITKKEIPDELFNLDILDGSPPCSTFSMAGIRESAWGKKKKFREGQTEQTLDDLFFEFIKLANRLKPKVIIAENVKGMVQGNARAYVNEVNKGFDKIGYKVQLFLLNAASMGVPQRRERVFFVCSRKDLNFPKLELDFNEPAITFSQIKCEGELIPLQPKQKDYWDKKKSTDKGIGCVAKRIEGKDKYFSHVFVKSNLVLPTITSANDRQLCLFKEPRYLTDKEIKLGGSYPLDYEFNKVRPGYLIGMSVPPVMTAQVAHQIYKQWLKPIKKSETKAYKEL